MAVRVSRLIFIDRLFTPVYLALSFLLPYSFSKSFYKGQKTIAIKLFGMGSIVRVANVLKQSNEKNYKFELITLFKNKNVCELLKIKAHYIRSSNPFFIIIDTAKIIFAVWKMKNIRIIDLERTSNLSGIFRLICSIGKSCSSFVIQGNSITNRNQNFISIIDKPALEVIEEIFEIKKINKEITPFNYYKNKIIINCNAGEYLPQRKYPILKYAELIKELSVGYPATTFVLTGMKQEEKYTRELDVLLKKEKISVENKVGKQTLSELVTELKESKLLITNDSGPLHLASYFQVPTVAIWGPTSPLLVGYPESDNMKNVTLKLECSPCFIHPKSKVAKACSNRIDCLQNLSSTMVFEAAKSILKTRGNVS